MWNLRSKDRLREWKAFRRDISSLSFDQAVSKTTSLWSFSPINYSSHTDYTQLTDFISPWELLAQDKFTEVEKVLGMMYTLYFSSHQSCHKFTLSVIKCDSALDHIPVIFIDDGKYLLNYQFNTVGSSSDIDDSAIIVCSYTDQDLQLHKY